MLVFGVYIFYIQTINGFHVNLENIFEVIYTTSSIELMSPPHGNFEKCFSFFPNKMIWCYKNLTQVGVFHMFCKLFLLP